MRVTDEQLDRLWRIRETLTDFADIAALELAISALSHAAGQDGEQCRAASVTRVSTHHVHRGPDSLPCYCLASSDHQIGNEVEAGPDEVALSIARQFVPADEPQKLAQLQCAIIRALSRGVPEGDSSDPERYRVLRDWFLRGGKLSEILPAGHVKRYSEAEFDAEIDRIRAIAAQRKEGP